MPSCQKGRSTTPTGSERWRKVSAGSKGPSQAVDEVRDDSVWDENAPDLGSTSFGGTGPGVLPRHQPR
ncbi:hypothetical protein MRX96_030905 [Rhipicephalus microplus]